MPLWINTQIYFDRLLRCESTPFHFYNALIQQTVNWNIYHCRKDALWMEAHET